MGTVFARVGCPYHYYTKWNLWEEGMSAYTPLQQRAYEYLLNMIRNGELKPGTIYSETKLASEIGISRTPVKDALVRLDQDRYIDILPSKGFCLHIMTKEDVETTFETRIAVEGYCVLKLAKCAQSDQGIKTLDELASNLQLMEELIDSEASLDRIMECDMSFHKTIAQFPGNPELLKLYESLGHRVATFAMESFERPERVEAALAEHRAIYGSVLNSGGEIYIDPYLAVAKHMDAARDIILEMI